WKLIHYLGKARPDLYGQYIPVQMRRGLGKESPNCNYELNGACKAYAVGVGQDSDLSMSYVTSWKHENELTPKEWDYENELKTTPPAPVPKGFVLMMGDNRNHSYDGRAWGLEPREDVIGRAEFIWLPIG